MSQSVSIIPSVKMLRLAIILLLAIKISAITVQPHLDEDNARSFLQLYNSFNPVVLLVDDVQQSQKDAANFIKNLYKLSPQVDNIDFMLMKFNTSGVSKVLATTRSNKQRFAQILQEKISDDTSNSLGRISTSAVFFGILNAVNVLPGSSAIVVFMKRQIEDEALAQHAFLEISKKKMKVFVVWAGKHEEYLLKELARRSRGEFFSTSEQNLSELYYEDFLESINMTKSASLILSRRNLKGEHNLNFPIDTDVTGIHINIIPNVTQWRLTTPTGYNIQDDLPLFTVGSFVRQENGMHEIHINTTTTQSVGIWRLQVSARTFYNITIFAHTKLTTNAVIKVQNLTGTIGKIVKLGVIGDVTSINNISFVDANGKLLLTNLKFNGENYLTENIDNIETNDKKEINIPIKDVPKEPFYAVIDGKDSRGHNFTRLSYVTDSVQKEFLLPPLTIDVGLGSELITQPYRQSQLFFEVTNNGHEPTLVRFFCRDEKGILLAMNPWYKWINSRETATVRVTLTTRPGSYQDFITFTAVGKETVTKKLIVDVGTNVREDRRDPTLDHHFTSDCTDVLFGSCEDGTWTVEIKAKDTGSGLLQVTSSPKGIFFPNGFTTGTTEEVTGFFSGSCCHPDLKLVAYDRQNNRRSYNVNAYRANLSPGAIAAIVLGVILLILIIIGIVLLCRRFCVYSKKDSYDLPVYRGPLSSRRT